MRIDALIRLINNIIQKGGSEMIRRNETVRHFIYIYKVPKRPRRIGFVYSSKEPIKRKDLPEKIFELSEKFELAIHRFTTDELSIDSIATKEAFFDNIEFYTDVELFSTTLKEAVLTKKGVD